MNQKTKPSTYIKPPNSYSTSPKFSRRVLFCHKSTSTIEKYPIRKPCKDQNCQTDPVEGPPAQTPLQRDYIEALRYINDCHEVMNQMYQQTRANLHIPEVPNFIDLYMHFNSNRTITDIAQQELQQNISQTHCTLIDSPYDDSVNTNNNYHEYSSPESDYELLAEPLKTYNKKQADIKRAKCLHAKHVLQDVYPEEMQVPQNKPLDVLYENNLNWRVSDHGRMAQQQNINSANQFDSRARNNPQEMSALDFENIVEELAQHASQKYSYSNNIMQHPQTVDQRSRSVPPMKSGLQRNTSPHERSETKDSCDDSPNDELYETKSPQKQRSPIDSPCKYEVNNQHSKHSISFHQSPQCSQVQSTHHYDIPASKLLQKSHQCRAEQERYMKQSTNNNQNICHTREREGKEGNSAENMPFYKAPKEVQPPNSFEKLMSSKKKRSKEIVKKQYSDSEIDEEYLNDEHKSLMSKNLQRSCVNATEEQRAVIRPNRTELISTVKYGRKVVMRTELAPSEHPNFRQQRQSEEQVGAKCGGDSSDISSDPEFLNRQ